MTLAGARPRRGGAGDSEPGLRVNLDTPLSGALAHSMTRTQGSGLDPVLVMDNAGRFPGVARMERMITALAAAEG